MAAWEALLLLGAVGQLLAVVGRRGGPPALERLEAPAVASILVGVVLYAS